MNDMRKKISKYAPSVFAGFWCLLTAVGIVSLPVSGCVVLLLVIGEISNYYLSFKGEIVVDTPEGTRQPYHPSVLFFESGWNSWSYWMAYTPMPIGAKPYTDRWECPCVMVSNDGVNWEWPGDKKALDDLMEYQISRKDYFSDPHLVYNAKERKMQIYYRLSEGSDIEKKITLIRRETEDGVHWSDRQLLSYDDNLIEWLCPTSPAFRCVNNTYQMWFVEEGHHDRTKKREIYTATSDDGLVWKDSCKCQLSGIDINPWHIDCQCFSGIFWLTIYDFTQRVSIWKSTDGIHFVYVKDILHPSYKNGSFYRIGLYRTCLVSDLDGYKAYFSAKNGRSVTIGLMQGKSLEDLTVISASRRHRYIDLIKDLIDKYTRAYKDIARLFRRQLRKG